MPRAAAVVAFARGQIGKWYRYAAAGPNRYDCSGLAMASWRAGGVRLSHSARQQYRSIPHLRRSALRPGDLVFYYANLHHVAIYIGSARVVHAPGPGKRVTTARINLAPIHGYGRPR